MSESSITRRDALVRGGTVAAGLALLPAEIASRITELVPQEAVVPWLNAPAPAGHVQPAPDDAILADKETYWESNGQYTREIEIV